MLIGAGLSLALLAFGAAGAEEGGAFARPKGASPLRVSLTPAYQSCFSPNGEHGPPLAFGSCAPLVRRRDI